MSGDVLAVAVMALPVQAASSSGVGVFFFIMFLVGVGVKSCPLLTTGEGGSGTLAVSSLAEVRNPIKFSMPPGWLARIGP